MGEDVGLWSAMAVLALLVVGVPGWLLWTWLLFRTRGELWLVVQLSGAQAPYPRGPVRGLLRVTPERITWGAFWGAGRLDLGSTGLQALYPRPVTPHDRANQSVALVCRDGRGTPVTVRVHPVFVERVLTVLLDRLLPALPEPPAVRRRRPGLTSVLPFVLIASGVVVLGVALARAGGDGVLGSNAMLLAVALLLTGAGAGALALRARRLAEPAPGSVLPTDPVRPRDATWQQLSATAAAAAVAEDWATARMLTTDTGSDHDVGARGARRWHVRPPPARLAGLATTLLVTGYVLWPLLVPPWASYSTLWSDVGTTSRAEASIVATQQTLPLLTVGNVTVEVVTTDGPIANPVVPVTSLPGEDQDTITVEYPIAAPERAWAVEADGRVLTAAVGGIALLLLGGYTARTALAMAHVGSARRAALRSAVRHHLRYVVVLSDLGSYLLLLFGENPGSLPRFGVALHEGTVPNLPVAGLLEMHGDLREGATAVPVVQGRSLATSSPLAVVGPEQALQLFERFDELAQRSHGRARHKG